MRSDQAKKIPLEHIMKALGHTPTHTARGGTELWYLSPFRAENTASFKVLVPGNCWYDHGEGKGGNVIDFALQYLSTSSVSTALNWLEPYGRGLSAHSKVAAPRPQVEQVSEITITNVKVLHHRALFDYVRSRGISPDLARQYVKEASFSHKGKNYFGLAFPNQSGGYELRNRYFKGSCSPKDITIVEGNHTGIKQISVFEGFMDFLSHLTLENIHKPIGDALVLNSLSFVQKAKFYIANHTFSYQEVHTYLDNNPAGHKATTDFNGLLKQVTAHNDEYKDHEDLNAYLVAKLEANRQHSLFNR